MASLSYEDIFNNFLGNVTDYDFINQSESDVFVFMTEYLRKTLSQAYVRHIFSSIELDDEIQMMSFQLVNPIDDESDKDFVINILSKGMVVEWLKPQVRNKMNVAQMFAGKEQKFFSQAQHLSELRNLLEDTRLEIRKDIRDYGYINNSYLSGAE